MTFTRPDISYSVRLLFRFMYDSKELHRDFLKGFMIHKNDEGL